MEKLSLDKFADKKIVNLKGIHGGLVRTTWQDSGGSTASGSDFLLEGDVVLCNDGMIFLGV